VGRLEALAFAIVDIEDEVVLEDVIVVGVAEFACGAVDGVGRAFEFDEGTDGGLVKVDDQAAGPFVAGGEFVGGAVLFVAEPAFEAQAFEDFLEGGGIGEDDFNFFADFVAAVRKISDGELFGRGFEGEDDTGGGFPFRGRQAA